MTHMTQWFVVEKKKEQCHHAQWFVVEKKEEEKLHL